MFILRAVLLGAVVIVSDVPAFAQAPAHTSADSNGNFGLSVVFTRFQTENFGVWINRGLGGWIDMGRGKWTTNVDASVTRNNWVVGVSALRRIAMADRPEVIHFLFGGGAISETPANNMTGAIAGGIGMDIPVRRFVTRIQYRVYCAGADGPFINTFLAGFGWTY
jgi:hypothetical protein